MKYPLISEKEKAAIAEAELRHVCELAIKFWGLDFQIDMMLEEMSELAQALLKLRRERSDPAAVVEELADCELMLYQMKLSFGEAAVEKMKEQKLARLKERILGASITR